MGDTFNSPSTSTIQLISSTSTSEGATSGESGAWSSTTPMRDIQSHQEEQSSDRVEQLLSDTTTPTVLSCRDNQIDTNITNPISADRSKESYDFLNEIDTNTNKHTSMFLAKFSADDDSDGSNDLGQSFINTSNARKKRQSDRKKTDR